MHHDPDASPINALPPGIMFLALAVIAPEFAFLAGTEGFVGGPGAVGWRIEAIERWGFSPALMGWLIETGRYGAGDVARLVTYSFIHWGFLHMVMVLVFLLALGKMVGEVMGSVRAVAIFFGSAVAGALVYGAIGGGDQPLIGGYPAVYGLIGAFTFLLRARLAAEGGPQARAFTLIGFLLGIQLLFGILFGGGRDWIAEVAGFCAGYGLSYPLAPGGWRRIVAALRQR